MFYPWLNTVNKVCGHRPVIVKVWGCDCKVDPPTCYVGYLNEHGRGEVDTLHELKVDVHMEGNLSPTFQLLLLCTAIVAGDEALWGEGRKGEGMERETGRGGVERGVKKEREEGRREMGDKTEKKEEVGRERRADDNATREWQLSTVHTRPPVQEAPWSGHSIEYPQEHREHP